MNRQKKTETTFRRSSALFNRAGVLVSWDSGFEAEFAPEKGLEGGTYFDIFRTVLSSNHCQIPRCGSEEVGFRDPWFDPINRDRSLR